MNEQLDQLLTELEGISTRALERAVAGELTAAAEMLTHRAVGVRRLQAILASGPQISYVEWNRLVVIHFQGKRTEEHLQALRAALASDLITSERDLALLGCVGALANGSGCSSVNEVA